MLVHEKGDELHLLTAIPDWWLGPGETIRIENAPTHFGPISLLVRGTSAGIEVQLTKPTRNPPKRIVLHLPSNRTLTGSLPECDIAVRPEQKTRWDFPTIIKMYRETRKVGSP